MEVLSDSFSTTHLCFNKHSEVASGLLLGGLEALLVRHVYIAGIDKLIVKTFLHARCLSV